MLLLWIVVGFCILFALLFGLMLMSFQQHQEGNSSSPKEYGIPFEEIQFKTKNHKNIYAWWILENIKLPTLILVHGWGKNSSKLMPYIKNLYGHGFNIMAFDSRCHGNSDDDGFSSMLKFAEDICAGIGYIFNEKKTENNSIYLLGLSLGGAASVYASARDQRIKKVVTVGAPANPAEVMTYQLKKKHIPYYPFIWALLEFIQLRIGIRFKNLAAENNLNKSEAGFFIIHGRKDKVVLLEQGKKLYHAANPAKSVFWEISDAGHSNCHYTPGFWKRIIGFLNEGNP